MPAPPETLLEEASLLARYLLGREAADAETLRRYADGCRRLFGDHDVGSESSTLRFALRHHWSLPCLDAACGLLQPESLLRKKLFLMLAILEASPQHADLFLPEPRSRAALAAIVLKDGAACFLKAAAGLLIYSMARYRR